MPDPARGRDNAAAPAKKSIPCNCANVASHIPICADRQTLHPSPSRFRKSPLLPIMRIEARALNASLKAPFSIAGARLDAVRNVAVRLDLAQGASGWGEIPILPTVTPEDQTTALQAARRGGTGVERQGRPAVASAGRRPLPRPPGSADSAGGARDGPFRCAGPELEHSPLRLLRRRFGPGRDRHHDPHLRTGGSPAGLPPSTGPSDSPP